MTPRWLRLPALRGGPAGCLNCGRAYDVLPLSRKIAVGFGDAHVSRDGDAVWREAGQPWKKLPTLRRFENLAARHPRHDWRVTLYGPLHGEVYQRQGKKRWVLVERNLGFA